MIRACSSAFPNVRDHESSTALHLAKTPGVSASFLVLLSFHHPGLSLRCSLSWLPLFLPRLVAQLAALLVGNGARTDLKNAGGARSGQSWEESKEEGHARPMLAEAKEAWDRFGCVPGDGRSMEDKQHWVKDDTSDSCLLCSDTFSLLKRRHHCRRCGLLVCGACSNKKFAQQGEQRALATSSLNGDIELFLLLSRRVKRAAASLRRLLQHSARQG